METLSDWSFELNLLSFGKCKEAFPEIEQEDQKAFVKDILSFNYKRILNVDLQNKSEISKHYNLIFRLSAAQAFNLGENVQTDLANSKSLLKEVIQSLKSTQKLSDKYFNRLLLLVFYIQQSLFLKENWLGKSYLYHDADHKIKMEGIEKLRQRGDLIPKEEEEKKYTFDYNELKALLDEETAKKLADFDLNKFKYKFLKSPEFVERKNNKILEFLSVDGEEIYRKIGFLSFFIITKGFLETVEEVVGKGYRSLSLWAGRMHLLHSAIMNEKLTSLQSTIINIYTEFLKDTAEVLTKEKELQSSLLMEFGSILLHYYKYDKSLRQFKLAQEILGLDIRFSGRLGVKTKYQTVPIPQLVVEVVQTAKKDESEVTQELAQAIQQESQTINPKVISVDEADEDTILLEKPKLQDLNVENLKTELSVYDQMLVLALIYHLQRTSPTDEILQEQVTAYLRSIMDNSKNWLVYSKGLYVRSLNEFSRWKTKQRAMLQLQTLLDQFNDKKPKVDERIPYFYTINYPCRLELQKLLAEKYMEFGMLMSSCELFESLEMYEECVECLAVAGHTQKATEKALQIIETRPTPKILCVYADITADPTYWKKAWQLSNKKYPRAKRSLGRYHFLKGNFQKSIKSYVKALEINSYHGASWFTLGCAYLKVQDNANAAKAFGRCVQIDETSADAWANLATAFRLDGKGLEAYNALCEAVKQNERSWKLWQNLLIISLENKKFRSFFEAIENLVELEQKHIIDDQVLEKLNQISIYHIQKLTLDNLVSTNFMQKKIEKLYKMLGDKISGLPELWARYQIFTEMHKIYNEKLAEIESIEIEPNSKYEGFVQQRDNILNERMTVKEIDEKVADLCLKECHSIMIVGWESDKKRCEQLEKAIVKLQKAYTRVGDATKLEQLKTFMETNTKKIKATLYPEESK